MTNKSILIYFDLRKYGFIEKTKNEIEIVKILSNMHSIIDNGMNALFAKIYKIQTDTSVYILDEHFDKILENKIREIKKDVDLYMKNERLPSVLHICIISGSYFSGYIKTENINHYNIFGEIMNKLEKCVCIIGNSKHKELNEGIVITKEAFELLNLKNKVSTFNELNEELYVL